MNEYKYLDKEEKDIMESVEQGGWRQIKDFEKKKNEFKEYALNTIKKDKRVNIRINEHDLEGIKRKAIEEGLPYQTLISSILHKYLNGKLVDANTIKILR